MADLVIGLRKHADVVWDFHEFWNCKNHYDIVHLHWPEYLSDEVESYLFKSTPLPKELWDRLKNSLEYWKKHSTIIYTRHVQYPHRRHDEEFLKLYRFVTSYCDTVVHFANFSVRQFKEFYPEHINIRHIVIPHHNYASLPNNSDKFSARRKLGINEKDNVMLVFGLIKDNERELINKAFDCIPGKYKVLLAPKWEVKRRKIGYIRLRELVWKFEKWLAKQNRRRRIDKGFISEDEAHYYLNAADFLFIPRTNELNSGNITLGFTFGLVVVGKSDSDIGEILQETNNPTFEVGNDESLKSAIIKALLLNDTNQGQKNKEIAIMKWNVNLISQQYIDEMNFAISLKSKTRQSII